MGVLQNGEDTEPRRNEPWTLHRAGTDREFLRMALPVRLPLDLHPKGRVVIRCYQGSDRVTVALQGIGTE